MKKLFPIVLSATMLYSINVFAAGAWIESREAYNTGTEQNEMAFRAGYNFSNGAGVMLTNAYDMGKLDQFKSSWNELEGWYPLFHVTPEFTILPAYIVTSTSAGSGESPYVDFN